MSLEMVGVLEAVINHEDLTASTAELVMDEIMSGRANAAHVAGLLTSLATKGETHNEIVGFARAMRSHMQQLPNGVSDCFDTCGTGGDGSGTFNVSSVSAIVLAACGVAVAKHGNRSVSSKCGSADLFEAFGVNIEGGPSTVERCLQETGIAFFFAPMFHPSMRHAGLIRRDLGIRTAFNLLGPLTNPAGAKRQLIGVPEASLTDLLAKALMDLGTERAWVVHGAGGLDEVSITGETVVSEVRSGDVSSFVLRPHDFGFNSIGVEELQVDGIDTSVDVARKILEGKEGAAQNFVLANSAAGLVVSEHTDSLIDGVALARNAIVSGRAARTLQEMVRYSNMESVA